jgi:MFS family permease
MSNPVLGTLVDKNGRIFRVLLLGGIVMILGHLINILLPDCKEACWIAAVPFFFYGIQYSIRIVVIYGSVPYFLKNKN